MRIPKKRVILAFFSILPLLCMIGIMIIAHGNPIANVFIFMTVGIPGVVVWFVLLILSGISLLRNWKHGFLMASFPLMINLLTLLLFLAHNEIESAQYVTDKDIIVRERLFSPDGNHIILKYVYDIGALGYTTMFTAVLAVKDTSKDLSKFRLPIEYRKANWLSNDSLEVEVDIRPYSAKRKEFKQDVLEMADIKIVVRTKGFDTSPPLFVEHRALSPDSTKELVAYRYRDGLANGHLHISVINKEDTMPRLGSLYVGNQYNDYVYFGEWLTPSNIVLYTSDRYMAESYLLQNDLGVEVKLIEKEYPITGVEPGWYHKRRYVPEQYLESELAIHGTPGFAIVKDRFSYADGIRVGKMDVLYTYEFNGKKYSAVFREAVNTFGKSTQVGDTLQILFSSRKPDVHKVIR